MDDLLHVLQHDYGGVAKLSKYVQKRGHELEKIFRLKRKGIEKEFPEIEHITKELKEMQLGKDLHAQLQRTYAVLAEIKKHVPEMNFRFDVALENTAYSSPDAAHLLEELSQALTRILDFFLSQEKIMKELNAAYTLAKKENSRMF